MEIPVNDVRDRLVHGLTVPYTISGGYKGHQYGYGPSSTLALDCGTPVKINYTLLLENVANFQANVWRL